MWFNTTLQLIQPEMGKSLGADLLTEKWVQIKFQSAYLGSAVAPAGAGLYDFLGSMADYPLMGRYSIIANHTGQPNTSFVIGLHSPHKVWRYEPRTYTLYFGTVETWTGTPSSQNQNTTNITNDLELNGVMLSKKGFVLHGGGYQGSGYHGGYVNKASWTNQPFIQGRLFWTSI